MVLPLKAQVRYEDAIYDSSACVPSMHVSIDEQVFDMQLAINDCTLNELIYSLYEASLLTLKL